MPTFKSSPHAPDTPGKTLTSRLIVNNQTGKCKKVHSSQLRMWRHEGVLKPKVCVCACVMLKSLEITVLLADGQCIYKQIIGIKEHQ